MEDTIADQQFLEFLIKSLVDHPEAVQVDRRVDEMGVLLTLRVHSEDMGHVIGREGGTAKSIRALLRIVGAKNGARVNLKIEEPERKEGAAGAKEGGAEKEGQEGAEKFGGAPTLAAE